MSLSDHIEYFDSRRIASLRLAEEAGDAPIAHLYRQFAQHYANAIDLARSERADSAFPIDSSDVGLRRTG